MPPKAKTSAAAGPSKKTDQKKKEKIIEDKTFGLKNKKGAKMQKYIQQVQNQVKNPGGARGRSEDTKKVDKEKKKKEEEELKTIFKPVQSQKVERGVDPKSVLCAFFKQGICTKGDKCKFSHDLSVERKSEKRSLYVDTREGMDGEGAGKEDGGWEDWDEEKLNMVAASKHGEADKRKPKITNVCKHFLDAVENRKFGWFWDCPNGEKCPHRHALPPGYVLKRDKKQKEAADKISKEDEISLEELIERERANLGSGEQQLTKVTLATFLAWKRRKLQEKADAAKKEEDKKRADYKAGRSIALSGREMFTFNPDLIGGDECDDGDEAFDTTRLAEGEEAEVEEDGYKYVELRLDNLEAIEADGSGTQAQTDRWQRLKQEEEATHNGKVEKEAEVEGSVEGVSGGAVGGETGVYCIDENLFVEDDLDNLDEELGEEFGELQLGECEGDGKEEGEREEER